MAKTTRKKKETPVISLNEVKEMKKEVEDNWPVKGGGLQQTENNVAGETGNIAIREEDIKNQPESVVTVTSNDTSGPLIVSPQEPAPQIEIPPAPQPAGQQTTPAVVTQEIVTARFNAELTKLQYQDALQKLENYNITEDNLAEAQLKLAKARKFLTRMDDIKSKGKEAALRECQFWDAAFKSIRTPLEKLLGVKGAKLTEIANAQAIKAEAARKEQERKDGINTEIDNFIIQQGQAIAGCKELKELVTIEKLIGSHKANASRYQEFLPDLIERSKELTTLITSQKETIKDLQAIEKQKAVAVKNNDDQTLIDLEDKKDALQQKIEENKVNVQEAAINQATRPDTFISRSTQVYYTVSARRTVWKAELITKPGSEELDPKELKNAFNAGLLKCEIDKKKTEIVLDALKGSGALKDKKEIIVNGIRYYESKDY